MGLGKKESRVYARAMKRLEYGYWGYPLSLFREVTLTTREGDDNSRKTANRHLKMLVQSFEKDGYTIDYCGVWLPTPGKGLMHWHGFWRIKGGYFMCEVEKTNDIAAKEVRKRWMRIHNAYEVDFDVLFSEIMIVPMLKPSRSSIFMPTHNLMWMIQIVSVCKCSYSNANLFSVKIKLRIMRNLFTKFTIRKRKMSRVKS